jgi:TniQ
MRSLLQRPLKDELLSSALVRTCVRFDLRIKPLMRSICGTENAPSFFHMSNLGAYATVLGLDPMELLNTATLFPSLVAFQPWERRERFESAALGRERTKSVGLSSIQSTSQYVPFRQLCPLCVKLDRCLYGWSFWHVSHHIPGVSFCSVHDVRLRVTDLTTASGPRRWSYELPDGVVSRVKTRPSTNFERELNRLALSTQFNSLWSALGPMSKRFYRSQLEFSGLVSPGTPVSAASARQWVAGQIKRVTCLAELLREDPALTWVELILRDRPNAPFPAIKHLVIQAATASTLRPPQPILDYKSTGNRRKDISQFDSEKSKELDARIRALLKGNERFTLREALESIGAWGKYRHARKRHPLVEKVIERHRPALLRMKNRRKRPENSH